MAAETEAEATPGKQPPESSRIWTLAEKGMAVMTGLLTLATATTGYLAVRTKSDLDDSEDPTSILQEDNEALRDEVEELTASVDDWRRRYEEASATTTSVASGAEPGGSSSSTECGSSTSPQIWVTPEEVPTNTDFVLTVTGTCFEPWERLRVSISESYYDCIDVTCTDITDVQAEDDGQLQTVQVTVYAAGNYQIKNPGTVYVVVGGDQDSWATQPLRLT